MAAKEQEDKSAAGFGSAEGKKEAGASKTGTSSAKKKSKGTQQAAVPKKKKLKNPMAKAKNAESQIPQAVSSRMIRRVIIASGIPSVLAFAVLPMSYYATEQGWVEIPSMVILVASIGCLGVGLAGISYGVLSASWDDSREGSLLGIDEFKLNLGRMRDAQKEKPKPKKK